MFAFANCKDALKYENYFEGLSEEVVKFVPFLFFSINRVHPSPLPWPHKHDVDQPPPPRPTGNCFAACTIPFRPPVIVTLSPDWPVTAGTITRALHPPGPAAPHVEGGPVNTPLAFDSVRAATRFLDILLLLLLLGLRLLLPCARVVRVTDNNNVRYWITSTTPRYKVNIETPNYVWSKTIKRI